MTNIRMKNFIKHTRTYILRGLFAIIPILLCFFALRLLYVLIDKRVIGFLDRFIDIRYVPGLGLLLLLICLYLIGLIVSNMIGHRFFKFIEKITQRIPLIKTIYGLGKQVSHGLAITDPGKHSFKKAVLLKVGGSDLLTMGFVMNSIKNPQTGEEFLFVLIPTAPTPIGGFLFVVKASEVIDPGWSIEESLKVFVSMGLIPPKDFKY